MRPQALVKRPHPEGTSGSSEASGSKAKRRLLTPQHPEGNELVEASLSLSDPTNRGKNTPKRVSNVQLMCIPYQKHSRDDLKNILTCTITAISNKQKFSFHHKGSYGYVMQAKGPEEKAASQYVVKTNIELRHANALLGEARAQHSLKHPNILPCPGYAFLKAQTFLLLPKAQEELYDRLKRISGGSISMDWPARFQICQQVANGLIYLHSNDLVHCDLTTSNILLTESHHAWISDFGRLKAQGAPNPNASARKTEHHSQSFQGVYVDGDLEAGYLRLAPDLFFGVSTTSKSDIYGWGKILLNMLQGQPNTLGWTNHPTCRFGHCPDECPHCLWPDESQKKLRSFTSVQRFLRIDKAIASADRARNACFTDFQRLAVECLEIDPDDRPETMEIALERANTIAQRYTGSSYTSKSPAPQQTNVRLDSSE